MMHLPILPILIPMLAAVVCLLPPVTTTLERQRVLALGSAALNLLVSGALLAGSLSGELSVYALGDWAPPEGISLVVDRLSALMLVLTALLLTASLLYASTGEDQTGRYFYPLMLFQVMGINGAFLTGDLFNLFVFFEILLIASYALLIHGGGKHKTRGAVHYVLLNLVGSAIFLFALGLLYGAIGSLNMADMALRIRLLSEAELQLAKVGGLMLLVVFGLKAAMLPLQFWLPRTYASAPGAIAALFAIMTKVGIYSLLRVHGLLYGLDAAGGSELIQPWLWTLSMLTLAIGALGVISTPSLKRLAGHLIIVSVGTLLLALAINTRESITAGLYYLIHSTLASAAFFLISEMISEQRGNAFDRIVRARAVSQPLNMGILFCIAALALIGLPPLSGFIGKVMVMQTLTSPTAMGWGWSLMLISSLCALIAFSRAGTTLFWRTSGKPESTARPEATKYWAIWLLLLTSPLLTLFAGSVTEFTEATAQQLFEISRDPRPLLPGGVQ